MADTDLSLDAHLSRAHTDWLTNPPAPQSSRRTLLYQEGVRDYFISQGFSAQSFGLDKKLTAVYDKNYDLLYHPYQVPRLAVSFKIIPLHELSAHFRTRLEEATGDSTNVHMQFPDLVVGYLWVLPVDPMKLPSTGDWEGLRQALTFLTRLTGRPSIDSTLARYEGIGIYVCSWESETATQEHQETVVRVKRQIPELLSPESMVGLLIANYRLRFGQLHEM